MEEWVDVTLTHPFKAKGRQQAASTDSHAVEAAEGRKRLRYGAGSGGVVCAPAGLELWGRLGASACTVLDRLSCQHAEFTGAARHSTSRRWRAELGIALYRALSATVAQACRVHQSREHAAGADALAVTSDSESDEAALYSCAGLPVAVAAAC